MRTGRTGAAAKAGHDLLIHVTAWQATLEVGEDPAQTSIVLDADATSLRVREGTGGMQALGDDDKASIEQTIDDDVLQRQGIEFRSTAVQTAADGSRISVQGELTLVGKTGPIAFDLTVGDDGKLSGSVVVKQTDWGITPYSALFGALKVADEVEVVIDATCRRADPGHVAEGPGWSDSRADRARGRRASAAPSLGPQRLERPLGAGLLPLPLARHGSPSVCPTVPRCPSRSWRRASSSCSSAHKARVGTGRVARDLAVKGCPDYSL